MALHRPREAFDLCLSNGLVRYVVEICMYVCAQSGSFVANDIPEHEQRLHLLSVCVRNNLTSVICHCMKRLREWC